MSAAVRSGLTRYGIGVLCPLVAVLARWAIDPFVGDALPLATLYGAVAVAVWFGGRGPGLLATALGYLFANYLFIAPRGSLDFHGLADLFGLAAYLASCLIIVFFGEAMHAARRQAEASAREALATQEELQREIARRQEALRKSAETGALLDAVVEELPVGIALFDRQGRYVHVNEALVQMNGVPREAHAGRTPVEVLGPAAADVHATLLRVAQTGRPVLNVERTLETRAPVGKQHFLANYFAVHGVEGELLSVGAAVVNVTELRRTQEQLNLERARLEAVLQQMPVGVTIHEAAAGRLVIQNERAGQLGVAGLMRPDGPAARKALHPDGRPYQPDEWPVARVLGRGEAVVGEEVVVEEGDDRRTTFELNAGPIRNPTGRIIAAVTTFNDVTDRKRAAEALREADRRKDEFLVMLAHELRNPLAPIRNAVEVLRLTKEAAADVVFARDVIDRQAQQLSRLVDDLLDVARITRGKINLRQERVDVAAVLTLALETCQPLIQSRRHALEVALPDRPLWVEADPVRLAQVFANLLANAAKYTDEGGRISVRAEVEGEDPRARSASKGDSGWAVVRVRDTGMGIPADMLPRIFDLFTQAERSLARSYGGLGVGLTLVRQLLELHGGSVQAFSDGPGRGSEFVVRLPFLAGVEARPGPGANGAERAGPSAARVLVAEDNRDAAQSLDRLLRMWGHEVRTVADGVAALEVARAYRPDVVLLDLGLPELDGYEVARRLRREPGLGGVLLVALTGYGQEEDQRRTREAGFDHHLVKPADPELLHHVLASVRGGAPADAG
jgi:PAS domain S-box-containing protein